MGHAVFLARNLRLSASPACLTAPRSPGDAPPAATAHPSARVNLQTAENLVTEPLPPQAPADSWDGILATLRRRYPGQRDSVLFCIHKLQQNPELTLRDFRDEAALHGIPMAGRALHSARVLLGLQPAEPRVVSASPATPLTSPLAGEAAGGRRMRRRRGAETAGPSIESRVMAAMQQLRSSADAEADQLRAAIRQAIAILQTAVGDR